MHIRIIQFEYILLFNGKEKEKEKENRLRLSTIEISAYQ